MLHQLRETETVPMVVSNDPRLTLKSGVSKLPARLLFLADVETVGEADIYAIRPLSRPEWSSLDQIPDADVSNRKVCTLGLVSIGGSTDRARDMLAQIPWGAARELAAAIVDVTLNPPFVP